MDLTGNFVIGVSSLTVSVVIYALLFSWINKSVINVKEFASDFYGYWQVNNDFDDRDESELVNLSHSYRALRKQLMTTGKIDEELLERSLDKADRKRSLLFDSTGQKYYAAWRKFKDLEREVSDTTWG